MKMRPQMLRFSLKNLIGVVSIVAVTLWAVLPRHPRVEISFPNDWSEDILIDVNGDEMKTGFLVSKAFVRNRVSNQLKIDHDSWICQFTRGVNKPIEQTWQGVSSKSGGDHWHVFARNETVVIHVSVPSNAIKVRYAFSVMSHWLFFWEKSLIVWSSWIDISPVQQKPIDALNMEKSCLSLPRRISSTTEAIDVTGGETSN